MRALLIYQRDLLGLICQREECASTGVHALHFAGIHGSKDLGAFSICLSGGYDDDKDEGDFM